MGQAQDDEFGRDAAHVCVWDAPAGVLRDSQSASALRHFKSWLAEAMAEVRRVHADTQQFKVVQLEVVLTGPNTTSDSGRHSETQ